MAVNEMNEFVAFDDVTIVGAAAGALHCRIGRRQVWLARMHVAGRIRTTGARGRLLIRRWVARDRHLVDLHGTAIAAVPRPRRRRRPSLLRLVRRGLA